MRVHRVGTPTEVHVVRKVQRLFSSILLCHLQLVPEIAAHGVQLPVLLPNLQSGEATSVPACHFQGRNHTRLLRQKLVFAQVVTLLANAP